MDYWEADLLCRKNKEFIFCLFPSGKIYTTFLPAEARSALGRVGKETEPVVHMLKKIGFQYKNQVDPFDGGPHLWANVDDVLPLKKIIQQTFDTKSESTNRVNSVVMESGYEKESGILCKVKQKPGQFRAVTIHLPVRRASSDKLNDDKAPNQNRIDFRRDFPNEVRAMLELNDGDLVAFMAYY